MVPLTLPLTSFDTYASAYCINDQKINVAPHFGHLDIRNEMVPLMILSALCDTDISISGIT